MACQGCSCSTGKDSVAGGCRSNGGCSTGGCNRHNTYDWITVAGIRDSEPFDIVEVSFKNGSRKEFFLNPPFARSTTGDHVLVESPSGGYDVGQISLSGELVRLQMKRKRIREDARLQTIIRKAHDRDMERLDEVRKMEKEIMVKARVVTRTLNLNMKICDIEFQGDGRKCTFYYTADGRIDFRELIRHYAKDFKVKIEMRQIGARQESARIGGIGNCGRELCCSTWLHEFKSVNTAAARYQNLAINQTKLSGMCGRLKCCLNYELDTYIDALEDFPERAERLRTKAGTAVLVKTDVFKRLMYYTYVENRSKFIQLHVDQVWDALAVIKGGDLPESLEQIQALALAQIEEEVEETVDFENVHDVIQLPIEKKKKKKKKKNRGDSKAAAIENTAAAEAGGGGKRREDGRDRNRPRPQRQPEKKGDGSAQQPRSENKQQPRSENKQQPRSENKPQQPRNENKPQQPRNENKPQQPRSENKPQQPRNENKPQQPRNENKPQQPRNENKPQQPRNENKPQQPRNENRKPKGGNNNPPKQDGNPPKQD